MNVLSDRMAKHDALWEDVLPKVQVKSHIFETLRGKLICMYSLGPLSRQFFYDFYNLRIHYDFPSMSNTDNLTLK